MSIVRVANGWIELPLSYPSEGWRIRFYGFFSSIGLILLALILYIKVGYYSDFLSSQTLTTLELIGLLYGLYLAMFYMFAPLAKVKKAKGLLTVRALKRIVLGIKSFVSTGPRDYTKPLVTIPKEEKIALLFGLVKVFFIPLMVTYMYGNYHDLRQNYSDIVDFHTIWSIFGFNNLIYPILLSLFLFIDTAFFTFGYVFEASFLKNNLRSVDPTVLGWLVALICYPPFNGVVSNYSNWYANDFSVLSSPRATFFLRIFSLLFMGIYASASVALGPKASNLTNRGIVGYGPYRFVRHPAYISKNLTWWITTLPVFGIASVLSMSVWSFIYFMRAITEERHLSADPDYLAYCKKVKYRFIPGII